MHWLGKPNAKVIAIFLFFISDTVQILLIKPTKFRLRSRYHPIAKEKGTKRKHEWQVRQKCKRHSKSKLKNLHLYHSISMEVMCCKGNFCNQVKSPWLDFVIVILDKNIPNIPTLLYFGDTTQVAGVSWEDTYVSPQNLSVFLFFFSFNATIRCHDLSGMAVLNLVSSQHVSRR